MLQVVLVHVHVKPDQIEDFKRITLENARNSYQEPGIARFDVIQQIDDPTRFILVEVYKNAEAPALHKETAHYQSWRDQAAGMMAEARTSVKYQNIYPADEGW